MSAPGISYECDRCNRSVTPATEMTHTWSTLTHTLGFRDSFVVDKSLGSDEINHSD